MLKRSWLSITRKTSKTIILLVIMFVIANLVLSTIFIKNTTNESVEYAKKSLGGEVYLQPDMEKIFQNRAPIIDGENNTKPKIERPEINIDMVNKIVDSSYLKDYSYSLTTSANASGFELVKTEEPEGQFKKSVGGNSNRGNINIEGVNSYAYINGVKNKTIAIKDGTYFDEKTDNQVLISYELALENNFKVNDTIKLKNPNTEKEIVLTIIGIYTTTTESNEMAFISNENAIYMNVKTASQFLDEEQYNNGNYSVNNVVFYLNNPEEADKFIIETKNKVKEIDENNLTLDINTSMYESMVGPIETVGDFATTILIIVIIASIIIISLIVNNQIKDRKYEIGVLMALGETKKKIVFQIFIELLIISTFAFLLATTTSLFVADKMADKLLQNQIDQTEQNQEKNYGRPGISFTSQSLNQTKPIDNISIVSKVSDYGMFFIIGYMVIFVSMIVPAINIVKYDPKTILTRRD